MKNYNQKIEEMRQELRKKEMAVSVLEHMESQINWNSKRVDDESEQGYHYEAPTEDDWEYPSYLVWKEAYDLIEKHFFGK